MQIQRYQPQHLKPLNLPLIAQMTFLYQSHYKFTKLRKEINRLDVMGFDELSIPHISELTKNLIARLLKRNGEAYLKIAKEATEEASEDVKDLGVSATPLPISKKYVDEILGEYNPVTGYLYYPEADRKRSRLAEALITAVIVGSRSDYHKQLHKFASLWHTQTLQYGEVMYTNGSNLHGFLRYLQ